MCLWSVHYLLQHCASFQIPFQFQVQVVFLWVCPCLWIYGSASWVSSYLTHWFHQSLSHNYYVYFSLYPKCLSVWGGKKFTETYETTRRWRHGIVQFEMETEELNDFEQRVINLIKVWFPTCLHNLVLQHLV